MVLGLGGVAATLALPAAAQAATLGLEGPLPVSSPMSAGRLIPAPAAWLNLLRNNPELTPRGSAFTPAHLSVARAAQLVKVNKEVNKAVAFRNDVSGDDFWEVADTQGDCEDYAIRKLKTLVDDHGFPRGALTLSACRLHDGRGHAVLLVHSSRGVYVMDSLTPRVLPWRKLPYSWVAREEPGAPFLLWRALS